jgi:GNAT superfamily N-acetyltransferase
MRPPRPARPDEAPALAALAEETFRATFGAANTRADLDLHCARAYGPAQQAAELADPALLTLVVTEGEALVAYAQLRFGAAAPACVRGARPAELCRLYALPSLHGRGAGPALLTAGLTAAAARGAGRGLARRLGAQPPRPPLLRPRGLRRGRRPHLLVGHRPPA